MGGLPPHQFSQGGGNYFRHSGNSPHRALENLDLSEEAIELYRQQRDDPYQQRLNMFKNIRRQRVEMQQRFVESQEWYTQIHGAIEAGFGGPSSSGNSEGELGMDYLA